MNSNETNKTEGERNLKMKNKMFFEERCKLNFTGEVFIKVGNNLTKENVLKNPDRHLKNIIVDAASVLIAEWSNADANALNHIPGITYLAVGVGNDGWDKFNPPLPSASTTILESEVSRAARTVSLTPYVDDTNTNVSTPTHIVDFEYTFVGGILGIDAILTEMGMFGGTGAENPNSGRMFNYLTFSAISKPQNAELTIVWRINFLPTSL